MARGDRCKTCRSPQRALIDTLLSVGHSPYCITWHLIRLAQRVPPTSIESHCEIHLQRPVPRCGRWSDGWRFTPYVPASLASDLSPELLLIRGLPGTGKTDVARTYGATHAHVEADLFFAKEGGYIEVKKDGLAMAHAWCQDWTLYLLTHGYNVVVANTFSQRWEIEAYLTFGAKYAASVRVLELPNVVIKSLHAKVEHFAGYMRTRWEPSPVSVERISAPSGDMPIPDIPYQCQPGLCPLGPPFVDLFERLA